MPGEYSSPPVEFIFSKTTPQSTEFDSTAVKVLVEGIQVGYIPKFDSPAVTEMVKKSGKSVLEVPVRIGFDTDSPQPLIGVRIALTVR
jgi:hypothetical protein